MSAGGSCVIRTGMALLGPGMREVPDARIVVDNGSIVACGEASGESVPDGLAEIDASELTVLPGFIDAHVHIGLSDPRAVALGGVTTVRDLGWPPDAVGPLVAASRSPRFAGPEVLAVGQMLTAPGGYPTRSGWAPQGTALEVDSPASARESVKVLASWGAAAIKIAMNPAAGPVLDGVRLAAIVNAAHAAGLRTTAHVTGLAELDKALEAGVDELAHMLMGGEAIPDTTIARMVSGGMVVIPTLAVRTGTELDTAIDNLRRFAAAGGKVVYGTDLGDEGPQPGIDPLEVARMADAGLSPLAIIRSATVDATTWLELADRGVLEPGRRADIIGLAGEPTGRAGDLTNVQLVMRAGRALKEP